MKWCSDSHSANATRHSYNLPSILKETKSGSLDSEKLVYYLLNVIKTVKPLGSRGANIKISPSKAKISFIFQSPQSTLIL